MGEEANNVLKTLVEKSKKMMTPADLKKKLEKEMNEKLEKLKKMTPAEVKWLYNLFLENVSKAKKMVIDDPIWEDVCLDDEETRRRHCACFCYRCCNILAEVVGSEDINNNRSEQNLLSFVLKRS
jgi:hypothetical protein